MDIIEEAYMELYMCVIGLCYCFSIFGNRASDEVR